MAIRVEIYVDGGIVTGVVAGAHRLRDLLESGEDVEVAGARWAPIDGALEAMPRGVHLATDDILVAAADDDLPTAVHATWHRVRLVVGPYVVDGDLPTMPGFDPDRALTRPTGTFVVLRSVRVSLAGREPSSAAAHEVALVNRYAVDEVTADLMLGFFFPGAHVPPGTVAAPTG
jgi:hypothetical protein